MQQDLEKEISCRMKKEIEIEDQSNEIARVMIDNLNCKQQNELLK